MIRKIIHIDEEKCNGCGLCARACHESAIGIIDGKAKLLREDYCDGLGDCLPACPTNAISFVEKEAAAYDEAAVLENKKKLEAHSQLQKLTEIIRQNNIKSVTIVRMEVPCCGGIQNAAINAMKASGKFLPWQVYTISTDGRILA